MLVEESAQTADVLGSGLLPRVVVSAVEDDEQLLGRGGRGVEGNHLGGGNDFVLRKEKKKKKEHGAERRETGERTVHTAGVR